MFDIDSSELALIAVVALLAIGPKDLPRVLRTVGQWVGRARGMARHVRAGFDTMVRESEIEEMNKRWESENRAIMSSPGADPIYPLAHDPAIPPAPSADFPADPGYILEDHAVPFVDAEPEVAPAASAPART